MHHFMSTLQRFEMSNIAKYGYILVLYFYNVYLGWCNVILSYARIYWIPNFSDIFILFANFYVMYVCEKMYIFKHFSRLRSQNVVQRVSIRKRQNNIVLIKEKSWNITPLQEYLFYYFLNKHISASMLNASI